MLEALGSALQRHRAALIVGSLALTLLVGCFTLVNRPLGEVRIEGALRDAERRLVQEQLHGLLQGAQPARILTVDLEAVAAGIRSLGWAQAVTVRRVWPETLIVAIQRQLLVARWQGDAALTSTGNVVRDVAIDPTLPVLEAQRTEPMDALALLQRLSARTGSGQRITALREQLGAGWKATLASGDQVVLGRGTTAELARRFRRFLLVRAARAPEGPVSADARYSHGVAVRATEDAFESAHELALARQEP